MLLPEILLKMNLQLTFTPVHLQLTLFSSSHKIPELIGSSPPKSIRLIFLASTLVSAEWNFSRIRLAATNSDLIILFKNHAIQAANLVISQQAFYCIFFVFMYPPQRPHPPPLLSFSPYFICPLLQRVPNVIAFY